MPENFDYLIIGSGIAGLTFALKVADSGTVAIVTKKSGSDSSTNYAQGGIASVFDPLDSLEKHVKDTMATGCGISRREAVETIVREGPERVRELFDLGVDFTRTREADGSEAFDLGREGGHTEQRIVHARDYTGMAVEKTLLNRCREHPNIRFFQDHYALDLLADEDDGSCIGASVLANESRKVLHFSARITLLCTGGIGRIYLHTTNPAIATGDGVAMAYRAGVTLGNLEFMQFHPTSLYRRAERSFLISEAVRGFGGILLNEAGERFMENYHPGMELAPRDVVARAIDAEMKKTGVPCVFLDVTHLNADKIIDRFPQIYGNCMKHNIDLTRDKIPVVPAAHYICGGVVTDLYGRTSMNPLYATGEVAMTGVHGANRLASNSLLEAVVFSHRAAQAAKKAAAEIVKKDYVPENNYGNVGHDEEEILITHDRIEIQRLMWDYVGIVRSNVRLQRAAERVKIIAEDVEEFYQNTPLTESSVELRNIAAVAGLVIKFAQNRRESRGLHYNADYPERDDVNWRKETIMENSGEID